LSLVGQKVQQIKSFGNFALYEINTDSSHRQSISIDILEPLFDLPIEFHSLQKELSEHELKFLMSKPNIKNHQNEFH
jgi:hypothetical protein